MEVIVDGDRSVALQGNPPNLLSAVAAVSEFLKARGRAIRSLKADGRDIEPSELSALGDRPLDDVNELEVASQSIPELVTASLKELEEVLPELPKACHALAAVFQGNNPLEGYEPFQRLAEIWGAVKTREQQIARFVRY